MPVQPEQGLCGLFRNGFVLHSHGGYAVRVRTHMLCADVTPLADHSDGGNVYLKKMDKKY